MGADRKVNTRELVPAPGGLLERLQCGVALEALGESSSSFGTEVVMRETASMGAEAGAESVNGRDRKTNIWGAVQGCKQGAQVGMR